MLTLRRLLERFPDTVVRAHPRLAMTYIWSLMGSGQWDEMEARLHEIEHLLNEHEQPPYNGHFSRLGTSILAARAALANMRGDADRSIELSQQALAAFPHDDYTQRSYAMLFLAMNYWAKGELLKARQALLETSQLSRQGNHLYVYTVALCTLGNVQMLFGQLQQAREHYNEALGFAFEHLSNAPSMLSMIHYYLAYLLYEQNALDEAQEHCAHSMQYPTVEQEIYQIYRYVLLAMIKQARGERDGAYALLQEAESRMMQYEEQQSMLAIYCASSYLCLGKLECANALVKGFHLEDLPFDWLGVGHLLQARLWLYQGEPAKTLRYLQPVLARVEEQGLIWSECRIMVLQALAWSMLDERERALALLMRGLSLAESAGFFRSLINEGAPLHDLLLEMLEVLASRQNTMPAAPYSQAYLQRLLAILKGDMQLPQASPQYELISSEQALAEPLSERELEILRLITTGLSNQEILQQLLIAKSTLKTHINHIYSKLDVRNREQATARARQLWPTLN
jgi:LuxR family maltose regulon positive regulatory protein